MSLAQWTLDSSMVLHGARGMRRIGSAAIQAARKLQVRVHDPLVTYQIGDVPLAMPLSHELPYHRKTFPQYASNVGRIGAAVQQKYPELSFIDIGANVGDTVAMVRQKAHYPILCIEGAPAYLPLLHRNVGHLVDVEIEAAFVGNASGGMSGRIELGRGTAHLEPSGSGADTIPLVSIEDVISRHPNFASAKIMKIDTDGMDCEIIAGSSEYLARARPVLFFEYDPDLTTRVGADAIQVFDVLVAIGYRYALVYENTGDLMLLLDLNESRLLADLHSYFSGHKGLRYADICAFDSSDSDLATSLRETEHRLLRARRTARAS